MVRVGIVGTGGMGNVHASKYSLMPDVALTLYDRDPEKLATQAARHGASTVLSFSDLVEASDVIDVCLPTDLHLEFGLQAIAAGRAVFMEKPMALDVAGCAQMMDAADKAGVPLMPAQVVRYFPEFEAAHETVVSGAIGKPGAARTRRGGKAPRGASPWFLQFERSGGVLLDVAIHDFDWLRWTLGEVLEVSARSVAISRPGPSTDGTMLADYALATLTFESGAIAHVEATWMDPSGFRTTFEVCGSEGMIEYDSRNAAALRTHREDGSFVDGAILPADDPYYREIRAFLDAVKNGTPVPVTPYDGFMAVSICQAALESARTGQLVKPSRG